MVIIVLLYIKYNIILLFPFFTVLLGFFFFLKKNCYELCSKDMLGLFAHAYFNDLPSIFMFIQ